MKGDNPSEAWYLLKHIFVESENTILSLSRATSFTFAGTSMQQEEIAGAVAYAGARAQTLKICAPSILPGEKRPSISLHTNTASSLIIDYSNGGYATGLSGNPLKHITACLGTCNPTVNAVKRSA